MRRWLKLVLIVGPLAGCGLAVELATAASAPTALQAIAASAPAGPLAAGPPAPLPCPPAKRHPRRNAANATPTGLTLHATPNPATIDGAVKLYGRVLGLRSGAMSCGITVVIWRRLAGQRHFSVTTRTRTDISGRYSVLLAPGTVTTNRDWFATARGVHSRTIHEGIFDKLTFTTTATFAVAGDRETFTGQVLTDHAGARLLIQRSGSKGRWQPVARPRVRASSFRVSLVLSKPGSAQWRAVLAASPSNLESTSPSVTIQVAPATGIHRIRHVVVIMQENRSFDSYFGTYPGANGIPHGVCVVDPVNGGCVAPFHGSADLNYGGPHGARSATVDVNGGAMDGFVSQAEAGMGCSTTNPNCSPCQQGSTTQCVDVMGYHDAREIPNYWSYARNFVLQDQMFQPNSSWSLPQHLFMVSEWSASCTNPFDPFSCTGALQNPNPDWAPGNIGGPSDGLPHYAWTDMTYLLHRQNVSWGYYVLKGSEPDCQVDTAMTCALVQQRPQTPGIWNPLPSFTDVRQDGQLGNIQTLSNFYSAAKHGTLPAVSWINPNGAVSEHPPGLVSAGQTYVTGLVNAIMQGPDWKSTAIFVSWDDWGGFYDHVVPPVVDRMGYGLRVPGLVISPYGKQGYIDHQILSHDAYNKFIQDDFLGGQRLDPATDGRPDPRPGVREANPILGDLSADFNFQQSPRPLMVLPVHPPPGPASTPP